MSIRDQLMAATADLPTTAEMKDANVARPQRDPDRPKTAVGAVAALSAAKLRIQELEQQGAKSTILVEKVRRNPWQPRIKFDELKLTELAENIKEIGLLQPILVRRVVAENGEEHFELIAGERRWRAHQKNGELEIAALVTEATDADMAVMAMAENLNREGLTDYEISKGMLRAEQEFPNRKRMAEAMGISRPTLYRYLAYSQLPAYMTADLENNPELLGGSAAADIVAVIKKHGADAEKLARDFWKQLRAGSLEQTKFAAMMEGALQRREPSAAPANRDIHKVYAGKAQAGSITKDAVSFTVKLKSSMVTEAQEERIRSLINELYRAGATA